MKKSTARTRRPLRLALAGKTLALNLLLAALIASTATACTVPGRQRPDPSAPAPATTAALAAPTSTRATTTPVAPSTAAPTVAAASPTPPSATPARATPPPTATSPSTGAATPSPDPGTPGATATPARQPFTATAEEPCRATDFEQRPLPQKQTTVANIEQAYRCLLLYYVDHKTLDHRVLLNGSWSGLAQAGQGLFGREDTAPLALVDDRDADWATFKDRFTALAAKYSRTVDASLLARAAIDGMARSLDDNHVFYLQPDLWQRFYSESTGENIVIGAGFDLAIDEASGAFYLYSVHPDSPASRAGLRAGDIIEQVGGRPARRGAGNQSLFDLLTGPVGTRASMRVSRPATGQTITAQVSVAEVAVPLIESRVIEGGIGYLKLRNFSQNAGEEFDRALAELQAQGIGALIFDVRQNPGGSTDALGHILSHFTHQGPLAITIDEDGEREELGPDLAVTLLGLPFVVLCNGGSASSADITAAVAKARGGHLVGEKSAGSLGGAVIYELEDGSAVEITAVRVLGPDGEEINEIGVTPDHVVRLTPADLSAGNDPQLQHAIADLARR